MYINTNAGIKKPQDLKGKRIGIPEYQSKSHPIMCRREKFPTNHRPTPVTAAVWQRGIMEEEFGVPTTDVLFFTGNIEPSSTERISKVSHSLPPGVTVTPIKPGQNLAQMLADGDIDALFTATKPSTFGTKESVAHLFPNFRQVEADYYRRTRIHPIMHVVAIRRPVYTANPWIAKTLQKAFARSLELAYDALAERGALRYMLPWLEEHVQTTKETFGEERWWQDGFAKNRHVLDKFLEYSFKQGLAKRKFGAEELFAPNTLESFVV